MHESTGPSVKTYRSPFVARLVANAMLDGLMESMQAAGIAVSPDTLAALQALRGQIDGRVRRIAAVIPHALPAPPAESVQALLAELHALIVRLDALRDAMVGRADPPAAPRPAVD